MAKVWKILDVSYWQPDIDYAKAAKDVDGVLLRIGITYWGAQNMGKDSSFDKHYAGFKALGVPVGAYYYSAADSIEVAKREAEFCLSLLKGKQFELPIYFDVENNQRQGSLPVSTLTDIIETFCNTVEKAGYYVGLYASTNWLLNKINTDYLKEKYTLWKADYRTDYDETIECDIHQYTSTGKVNGISGNVDLSHCYVDFPTIIKSVGLNGFGKHWLSESPCRLHIGFASQGDIKSIKEKIAKCGSSSTSDEGYIITDELTKEAQSEVVMFCNSLGVPCDIYKGDICDECVLLKEEVQSLQRALDAETQYKEYYKDSFEVASKQLADIRAIVGG